MKKTNHIIKKQNKNLLYVFNWQNFTLIKTKQRKKIRRKD